MIELGIDKSSFLIFYDWKGEIEPNEILSFISFRLYSAKKGLSGLFQFCREE